MAIRWRYLAAAAATAVAVGATGTGCAADRSAEAEQLCAEVQTMPGVAAVNVSYINDFENGANLDIRLDMAHATEAQISAAAQRIDKLKGSAFDDHRQSTEISVAERAVLEYHAPVALSAVAAEAHVLRAVRAQAAAGTIKWQQFDEQSRLEMWDSPTPDSDLKIALREVTTGATPKVIYVRSDESSRHSSWEVSLPLTVAQMDAIVAKRDELPVVVYQVDVHAGRISEPSVNLGAASAAYRNVLAMIAALRPTPAHPVGIEWRLADAAPGEIGRFTACSAPVADASPDSGFADLQERLESQFAGCD